MLVQDQLKFDERWVVMGALRRDQARNTEIGGSGTDDQALTKNLGQVYLARGGFSPYLGYSESFEPQTGTDRSGKAFDPRRGGQFEASLKWAPAQRNITASAALYRLEENVQCYPTLRRVVLSASEPNRVGHLRFCRRCPTLGCPFRQQPSTRIEL